MHLTDPPFLVVTLSEIEIASLERVQFSLKQFDMVLIFSDFSRPPLQINSISSSNLDDVKHWLESVPLSPSHLFHFTNLFYFKSVRSRSHSARAR